jgi:NAD(P)-dependent dehydrogenase (short-subunit alcohol dehydrogenase family)
VNTYQDSLSLLVQLRRAGPGPTVKGATLNFARQASLELAPQGVGVNPIAPGPFRTNIGAKGKVAGSTVTDEDWVRTVPLGRTGDPAELKELALLLGSNAGSFITGGVYLMDGGAMLTSAI